MVRWGTHMDLMAEIASDEVLVRVVNETLAALNVEQHPDKTFVGRISRGFDFLGYDFSPAGMTGMSRRTVEKFAKRVAQLDEQGADAVGIGQYVRRWVRWTTAGLDGSLRWKETELPWGIESVSGRLLPGLLSLRDPDNMLSGPPAELQIENTKTVLDTFVSP